MSEIQETQPAAPRRGRAPRIEANAHQRRRRQAGSLDRMVQMNLGFIPDEALDLTNYVYRWINDEKGRLRHLTQRDDYDFVAADELGEGFAISDTDSESDGRISVIVEERGGKPLKAFLCRKPRTFWEADNEDVVRHREDMMAGRVYRNEATEEDEGRPGGDDNFYASAENSIGHAAERRRGPIPRRIK